MSDPIRVLVVDDSVVIRRLLTTILESDPDLEVAGVAANGAIALQRIRQLQPDIVTLDVEMPEMDGLETLLHIRSDHPNLPVIMFSTLTERGAGATLEALSRGASDYVAKPANIGSVTEAMERVRNDLVPKLKALVSRLTDPEPAPPPLPRDTPIEPPTGRYDLVAIGSSTGGPNALAEVLASIPGDLDVPIVVVQHMPPVFTRLLAERLDTTTELTVTEASGGEQLEPNHVYIAPGDRHMIVRRVGLTYGIELHDGDPINFCRPAVDELFRSVAESHHGHVLAAVLTGMGHDGRDGCSALKARGAMVIAQDRATSVVWGMPGAVVTAGLADRELPISVIGRTLHTLVRESLSTHGVPGGPR